MRRFKKWMEDGMTVKAGKYLVATIISSEVIRCKTNGSLWVNGFKVLIEGEENERNFVDGVIFKPISALPYERQTFNDIMLSSKKTINVRFKSSAHFRTLKLSQPLSGGFVIHGKIHGHDVNFHFKNPKDLSVFPYVTIKDIDEEQNQNAEIHNVSRMITELSFERFMMKKIDLNEDGKGVSNAS